MLQCDPNFESLCSTENSLRFSICSNLAIFWRRCWAESAVLRDCKMIQRKWSSLCSTTPSSSSLLRDSIHVCSVEAVKSCKKTEFQLKWTGWSWLIRLRDDIVALTGTVFTNRINLIVQSDIQERFALTIVGRFNGKRSRTVLFRPSDFLNVISRFSIVCKSSYRLRTESWFQNSIVSRKSLLRSSNTQLKNGVKRKIQLSRNVDWKTWEAKET